MVRTYSIKDLEILSGIKAHTLRIWEKRYDLLQPIRTETNIRRYSDEDLKLLLNVSLLNRSGYKISRISSLSKDEIAREVYRIIATDQSTEVQIEGLRRSMITLNEAGFIQAFSNLVKRHGLEEALINVIFPFLDLVGVLWQTGTITPLIEHFTSSIIRQKINVALDALPVVKSINGKDFLLACPEEEFHEIGLLFSNYMLRSRGCYTIYCGADVPSKDLALILKETGIRNLFLSIICYPSGDDLLHYLQSLKRQVPDTTSIYLSGRQSEALRRDTLPSKMSIVSNIDELKELLANS